MTEQFNRWSSDRPVGFDFETNGKSVWVPGSEIVGVSLAGYEASGDISAVYVPLAHRRGVNADRAIVFSILDYIHRSGMRLVPFNAQFEHQWALGRWNVRLPIAGDGYIAARLLQLDQFGLKDLVEAVLGETPPRFTDVVAEGTDFSLVDPQDPLVQDYVLADARNALRLEHVLREELSREGLADVYALEVQASLLMAEQTLRGYEASASIIVREVMAETDAVNRLEMRVFRELGTKSFSINSGAQLGKALNTRGIHSPLQTEKTKVESWSAEALELLKDVHPVIATIREWKSRFANLNTLKRAPFTLAQDGRLHPRWRSIGVQGSARMVAEKPALTNLPVTARRAFRARPGRVWVSLRFPDLEARMIAIQSGDVSLLDAFHHRDPWATISQQTGVPQAQVQTAFWEWVLSGGSDERFSERYPEAQALLAAVFARARDTGEVRLWWGRRRWLSRQGDARLTCSTREAPRPEARGRSACSALGMEAAATAVKHLLLRIRDGIEDVIPGVDVLYYTVAEAALEEHQRRMPPLLAADIEVPHEWRVGPSWGDVCN